MVNLFQEISEVLIAYGALYNFYAVDDIRGLCPTGWKIPSDNDWKSLEIHIGMSQTEVDGYGWRGTNQGGKLKSTRTEPLSHPRWENPNTGATDEFGFCSLPSGHRFSYGAIDYIGIRSFYWTSSENSSINSWSRHFLNFRSEIGRYMTLKEYGLSVRCIRETPFNLTLLVNPSESGTVTGSGEYQAGEMVTINALQNPGYCFVSWTDEEDNIQFTQTSAIFTMPARDITLTANFSDKIPEISFTPEYFEKNIIVGEVATQTLTI